MISISDDVRVV